MNQLKRQVDRQNAINSFDFNIGNARQIRQATIDSATASFNNAVRAADQAYTSAVQAAATNFATDMANYSGDPTSFELPEFEWGEAPPRNPMTPPDPADLARPPVDSPNYNGPAFNLIGSPLYQSKLAEAREAYRQALKSARATLDQAKKAAQDALALATNQANQQYRQNVATYEATYESTKQSATSSINLYQEREDRFNRNHAAHADYMRDLVGNKATMGQDLLLLTDQYGMALWLPLDDSQYRIHTEGQNLESVEGVMAQIWVEAANNFQVDQFNALQSGSDGSVLAPEWEAREDGKNAAALALRQQAADIMKQRAEDDATDRKAYEVDMADSQRIFDHNIAIRDFEIAAIWLKAKSKFETDRAAAVETRKNAIALESYTQALIVSAATETHDNAVATAEVTRWTDTAQAKLDAIAPWVTAEGTDWANYQQDLVQNEFDYWSALSPAYTTFMGAWAAADETETNEIAQADKVLANDLALAEKDRVIARSTALMIYQRGAEGLDNVLGTADDAFGEIHYVRDRAQADAQTYKDEREAFAEADRVFVVGDLTTIGTAQALHDHTDRRAAAFHTATDAIINAEAAWIATLSTAEVSNMAPQPWYDHFDFASWVWYGGLNSNVQIVFPVDFYDTNSQVLAAEDTYWSDIALSNWEYSHDIIDAREAKEEAKTAAIRQYKHGYYANEKTWSDGISDLRETYDSAIATANANHDVAAVQAQGDHEKSLADADVNWWTTFAPARETYQNAQADKRGDWSIANAQSRETFHVAAATEYFTEIQTWDLSEGTPWSLYQRELATAELAHVTSMEAANVTYVTGVAAAEAGYTAATAAADTTLDIAVAGARQTEVHTVANERDNFSSAVADDRALGTAAYYPEVAKEKTERDKNVTAVNQTYKNAVATQDETLQDAIDDAEWKYQRAKADLDLGYQLHLHGGTPPTGVIVVDQATHATNLAAAATTRKGEIATANENRAKTVADLRVTWTAGVGAEDVQYALDIKALDDDLATDVKNETIDFDTDRKNATILHSTQVHEARRIRDVAYASADETRGNAMAAAEAGYRTAVDAAGSAYRQATGDASGDYDDTLHANHVADVLAQQSVVQAGVGNTYGDTSLAWINYQYAVAMADATLANAINAADSAFNAGLGTADANYTSAINTASTNHATQQGAADKTFSTSMALHNKTRSIDHDTADAERTFKQRKSAAERADLDVSAESTYDVEQAKARRDWLNARAVSNHDWTDAMAFEKGKLHKGDITQTQYDTALSTQNDNRDADYKAADVAHVTAIGVAQVARATALGANLVDQATKVGQAKVEWTQDINTAEASFASSEPAATLAYDADTSAATNAYDSAVAMADQSHTADVGVLEIARQASIGTAEIAAATTEAAALTTYYTTVSADNAADFSAWAPTVATPQSDFLNAKAQAESTWVGIAAPALSALMISRASADAAYANSEVGASVGLDNAIASANTGFVTASGIAAAAHSAATTAAERNYVEDSVDNTNLRMEEFAKADKAHLIGETNADRVMFIEEAKGEKAYQLGLLGVGLPSPPPANIPAAAQDLRDDILAEANLSVATINANADRDWSVSKATANDVYAFAQATDLRDKEAELAQADKDYEIAMNTARGARRSAINTAEVAYDAAMTSASSTYQTSNATSLIAYRSSTNAARASATGSIASALGTPWATFTNELAVEISNWWSTTGISEYNTMIAGQITADSLYQSTISTARTAQVNAEILAEDLYTNATAEDARLLRVASSNAYKQYTIDVSAATKDHLIATANAERDHKVAIAEANRHMAIGEDFASTPYGTTEFNQAIETADTTKQQAIEAEKQDFAVDQAAASGSRRNTLAAAQETYVKDIGFEDTKLVGDLGNAVETFALTANSAVESNQNTHATLNSTYLNSSGQSHAAALGGLATTNGTPWAYKSANEAQAAADWTSSVSAEEATLTSQAAGAIRTFNDTAASEEKTLVNSVASATETANNSIASAGTTVIAAGATAANNLAAAGGYRPAYPSTLGERETDLPELEHAHVDDFDASKRVPDNYDFNIGYDDLVDNMFTVQTAEQRGKELDPVLFTNDYVQSAQLRTDQPEGAMDLQDAEQFVGADLSGFWTTVSTPTGPTANANAIAPPIINSMFVFGEPSNGSPEEGSAGNGSPRRSGADDKELVDGIAGQESIGDNTGEATKHDAGTFNHTSPQSDMAKSLLSKHNLSGLVLIPIGDGFFFGIPATAESVDPAVDEFFKSIGEEIQESLEQLPDRKSPHRVFDLKGQPTLLSNALEHDLPRRQIRNEIIANKWNALPEATKKKVAERVAADALWNYAIQLTVTSKPDQWLATFDDTVAKVEADSGPFNPQLKKQVREWLESGLAEYRRLIKAINDQKAAEQLKESNGGLKDETVPQIYRPVRCIACHNAMVMSGQSFADLPPGYQIAIMRALGTVDVEKIDYYNRSFQYQGRLKPGLNPFGPATMLLDVVRRHSAGENRDEVYVDPSGKGYGMFSGTLNEWAGDKSSHPLIKIAAGTSTGFIALFDTLPGAISGSAEANRQMILKDLESSDNLVDRTAGVVAYGLTFPGEEVAQFGNGMAIEGHFHALGIVGSQFMRFTATARFPAAGPINLMKRTDNFLNNASKRTDVDPLGYLDVVAHGNAQSIQVVTKAGKVHNNVSPEVFARYLRRHPDFNGQTVRLLSCNTGSCSTGFAQRLSNQLGVDVIAPDNYMWAWPNGRTGVAGGVWVTDPVTGRTTLMWLWNEPGTLVPFRPQN